MLNKKRINVFNCRPFPLPLNLRRKPLFERFFVNFWGWLLGCFQRKIAPLFIEKYEHRRSIDQTRSLEL